ncbi:MAG TPA: sugar ABC transporter permease YjfF [Termitinemataceae bacterium]|jgi:simple sugar transport system permease protein|uniref:galactofuranose ABC transporter, permease protein YjfF n=1 Tax=Treponema sp. J25 TaxID=2094121 RepID=UPI00104E0DF2|nr:galactofuranose ABC transporter, permease protein YjfF [Treponema sp. J25]TCW62452.1 sugar ABC transporter permease YjfF [Treponema sp. J25]HOJ99261.1 sugar ABC transporter permease YjfF [Termitinemataceae bacterium]HOM23396.1 sugar ABC transporter permease YjfF [Termitinemataceae bacterium]HPQ01259.1 sugar ABC transporter permease YjfF [Termitinemataceae bacterium]
MKHKNLPLLITLGLFIVMYGAGSLAYSNFFSLQVFINLFIDNAFLGIAAVGMTFVIISGGIDLSVGSVVALTTMLSADLLQKGFSPTLVIPLVLLASSAIGAFQGIMIQYFKIQPFIATLAGMFFARGACYLISIDTINIENEWYRTVSMAALELPTGDFISVNVFIFVFWALLGWWLLRYTRFGRTVYAIGGSEQSALLMGLPVPRTKVLIYTFNGLCSGLAGVVFTFYMLSGYALHCKDLHLDAIAAVVMGGTLLTGGVGSIEGSIVGVLILGTIQTIINFQGTLSSWWTRIVVGILIFVFIFLQSLLNRRTPEKLKARSATKNSVNPSLRKT